MRNKVHHPQTGIGLFLIVLGIALLIATNDLLHLGSIENYFTWQTGMIFIGIILLVNLHLMGGILLIAGGIWFYMEDKYLDIPSIIKTIYWPAVIMLVGVSFIISSLFNRKRNIN